MRFFFPTSKTALLVAALGVACFAGGAALISGAAAKPDEPASDTVGTIDGDAITVEGPMTVEVVRGQVRTMLRSGSDIRVKSGQARIDLVEGGAISICGPAHLSVLKSAGALTVALDSGTVHVHVEREPAVVIYTAQIQAKPMAIGGGPQDVLVGVKPTGEMCIVAKTGAVKIEQQLTAQSVILPQGGDIELLNAQFDSLRAGSGGCACELQLIKTAPQAKPPDVSVVAAEDVRQRNVVQAKLNPNLPAEVEKQPVREEPVYQVFMPPLAYDASATVQPEPDPNFILLVRRVRVRPSLIFHGRVKGEPANSIPATQVAAVTPPAAPQAAGTSPGQNATPASNNSDSVVTRVRNFLRRIWNSAS